MEYSPFDLKRFRVRVGSLSALQKWSFAAIIGLSTIAVIPSGASAQFSNFLSPPPDRGSPVLLFVSPRGNDQWSGRQRTAAGEDGPLATVAGARDRIRRLRRDGKVNGPVLVHLEPGNYSLRQPLIFEPDDSGTALSGVTFEGDPGGTAVLSGGRVLPRFRREGSLWVTRTGGITPTTLWVNGKRCTPARTPDSSYFYIESPATPIPGRTDTDRVAFRFRPGDIQNWPNLSQIRIIAYHNWETSIHPIESVDEATHTVVLKGPSVWPFEKGKRYLVENAPRSLTHPGEWRYMPEEDRLEYYPGPAGSLERAEAVIPVLDRLVEMEGDRAAIGSRTVQGQSDSATDTAGSHLVENLHFRNLTFAFSKQDIGPDGHHDPQAEVSIPAAIDLVGSRTCSFENCRIVHIDGYGIAIHHGSQENRLEQCEIADLGAGGVRIGDPEGSRVRVGDETARNTVDNCYIHDYGRRFQGAVGVIIFRSSENQVTHNDIGHGDYTGVSVGWSWGYDPSSAHDNHIDNNRIHDIGREVLSDMGAIYTLGVSPGTTERHNVIHDIYSYPGPGGYGGWGVYTDEGTSDVLVENNLVYNTSSGCFHQHYGENNTLRNNIFAFGVEGVLRRTREEIHNSFTFDHNIVVSNGSPFFITGWSNGHYNIDHNLYWDYARATPEFFGMSFADWQAKGRDQHSILENPEFAGIHPRAGDPVVKGARPKDFRLRANDPAVRVGFVPFSYDDAGLYGDPSWTSLPGRR